MKTTQSELYDIMLREVSSAVDRQRIESALELKSKSVKYDIIIDALRNAVLGSTLHSYNSMPHVYTGKIYERLDTWKVFDSLVYDVMRRCGVPDGYYGRIRSMACVLESAVRRKVLVPDPALMVFNNCIFDTETREIDEFSPDKVAMTMVDYDYDPDDQPTQWIAFLNRVLPDREMQLILQEYLGSVFVRRQDVKIDKILVLLGGGANGKSVVFETVRGVLGKENVNTFGLGSLIGGGEALKNIATINGKRLNYSPEIQVKEFGLDSDKLKSLASGEAQEARFITENPFTANDIPPMMANANRIPAWNDPSSGMRRRFLIIPFNVEIPVSERDLQLVAKLRRDYSGIFNWIMDGKTRLISNGYRLSNSEEIEEMLDEYQAESSTVLRFMLERKYLATHPERSRDYTEINATVLFQEYVQWCYAENISQTDMENKYGFARVLKAANYVKKKCTDGIFYRIYCDRGKVRVPFRKEPGDEGRTKFEVKADMRPFNSNGRKYVRTRHGIAKHLGVGESIIQTLLAEKKLAEAVHKDKSDARIAVFDIELTRKAVMEYYQSKKISEEELAEGKRLSVMRQHFNARMKRLEEPYRKYHSNSDIYFIKNSDSLIRVPDDWDYDTEVPLEKQSQLIARRRIKRKIEDYAKEN